MSGNSDDRVTQLFLDGDVSIAGGMPDVGRSDSQRSDASSSLKPRVSFNRDVHVKRIVPRGKLGVPSSAGIGEGSGAVSPVRKKPINKSQEELEEEAARVLQQVDEVDCVVAGNGLSPSRFYTLPTRKKKTYEYPSLDRRTLHRGSQELLPPKKPPRTFAAAPKSSIFDVFKRDKHKEPKKSNLRRSVSDVSSHKSKDEQRGINVKLFVNDTETKKQLSPIIEVTPREDYFDPSVEGDREDDEIDVKVPARKKKRQSITEKLKQFIDEVDEELYKETGVRPLPADDLKKIKEPQPIIIDVDKAEKISGRKKKFKASLLAKKFKVGKNKKNKTNEATKLKKTLLEKPEPAKEAEEETIDKRVSECLPTTPSPRIKEAIETLEHHNNTSAMIHSSQKPVDKLPLTKGRTVDPMVKRLSRDSGSSPPPKPNVMVTPHASVQHNNNQPFSYTRGLSPEKYNENVQIPGSPIIYAQVVCGNNTSGPKKQTIHTAYTNGKKHPHSDSDEGLGGEEHRRSHDYYDEGDKFEEESPITPKFRNPAFINGYNSFERKEFGQNGYIERGRGDGMDAKRRESLTEQMDNDFSTKHPTIKGRSDLSARRDLLESRIARRVNDSVIRTSPVTNTVYITESTSKYYRERSTSPVGYSKKYSPDPKPDRYAKPTTTDPRNKKYYGEPSHRHEYDNNRTKTNGYTYNGFDSEPKSFDSQISDYRSSPENRHFDASPRYNPKLEKTLYKDRTMYKSTPEIHLRSYQDQNLSDSYHDSLRREKVDSRITSSSKYRSERFLDENERKEKFVDSGIENDFRRDSGDNFRVTRPPRRKEQYCNESEDEGFASSLLIASEKQHTEENASQKKRRDYDSDRTYSREDDPYRHLEAMEYKSKFRSNEYIPRERSIDDGSHYDPRIDKDEDKSTLKRVDTKPPKPEKKSGLEKVKSLFTRKKDKQLPGLVSQDSLRARYVEYKGRESIEPKYQKKEVNDVHLGYTSSGSSRRRSSPSGSTTRDHHRVAKSQVSSNGHSNWFKSLDRLAHRKKSKKEEPICTSGTESDHPSPSKPACKNLRFFGDTDLESNDSIRHRGPPQRSKLNGLRGRSQSSKDLHNISEEMRGTNMLRRREGHRSMVDIVEEDRDIKGSRTSLKPPMSPSHRPREMSREKERARRRKNEVSSVESSTEGDSSQQSQRSIVYLHAATVGDIPGPSNLRNGRRAASREELASNSSSRIQPQVKTLSRSFSVLAPWRPRNPKEAMDIDYAQQPRKNGKYEQRVARNGGRKDSSSTLKKKAQESRKNQSNSTLNRRSRSKENLGSQTLRRSKDELTRGSNSTLYKKKERLPRENSRYNSREEKKMSSKSLSVESLGGGRRSKSSNDSRDISRSVSMPRDPEKSAGWFKMSKKKHSGSTQRL